MEEGRKGNRGGGRGKNCLIAQGSTAGTVHATSLIPTTASFQGRYYYPHFTVVITEA